MAKLFVKLVVIFFLKFRLRPSPKRRAGINPVGFGFAAFFELLFYAICFYCKQFCDPKHVHCYLIHLRYYGSVWSEDDYFSRK
jgi:hypothetical protein